MERLEKKVDEGLLPRRTFADLRLVQVLISTLHLSFGFCIWFKKWYITGRAVALHYSFKGLCLYHKYFSTLHKQHATVNRIQPCKVQSYCQALIFSIVIFYYLVCLSVCKYIMCMSGACGGQKRGPDPLGLELWPTMWVLGIKPESFLRAPNARSCWAIFAATLPEF